MCVALAALDAVLASGRRFDPKACHRCFTIASTDNIGVGLLPAIIARLGEAMPLATLQMVTLDHAIASGGLVSGEVDVLLGLPQEIAPGLRSRPAYVETLLCALRRDASKSASAMSLNIS